MTDRDRILSKTNGGLDVFTHYIGDACTRKVFRNPFRNDSNPSCHLYYHADRFGGEGRYILKDFGDSSWVGDCFWFVARLTGLNQQSEFREILRTIDRECELFLLDDAPVGSHPVMSRVKPSKHPDSSVITFTPTFRNFNKRELEYWESYGITPDILRRYHVRALSNCLFGRSDGTSYTVYGSLDSPMFGYTFNEGTGIKAYRPSAQSGRFMYAGSLPKPYVFGLEQLNPLPVISLPFIDILSLKCIFVTGGEKDVMTLASRGLDAISLNSETARMPRDLFIRLSSYQYVVFLYDSDETGVRESRQRVSECGDYLSGCSSIFRGVFNVTLPLPGTKSAKDISDYFRLGNDILDFDALVYESLAAVGDSSHFFSQPVSFTSLHSEQQKTLQL